MISNFTDYFREEKDIWIQNISSNQVTCQFEISTGNYQSVLIQKSRDPINLTQQIPFQIIKNSPDFRKLANRRPPVFRVMTEDEVKAYYLQKAGNAGDWREAYEAAEEKRLNVANRVIPENTTVLPATEVKPEVVERVSEEDVIHPKVVYLMIQVDGQIPDAEKMKAHELLTELQLIEDELKTDDLDYILAKGFWKSVKTWAKSVMAKKSANTAEGDG
jgi:hypothetical protein